MFKLESRTTNAVEAYNGTLGRKIIGKSNFYKFVEAMRDEEYAKSKDMRDFADAGGLGRAKKTRAYYTVGCKFILYFYFG